MKGLVLLDWDNTIVDEQVTINDSSFYEIVQTKIAEGWQIGLNSDTPFKRLHGWWKSLNMNGPIVAEKGAVIWWPNEQPITLAQTAELFSAFRKDVLLTLTKKDGYTVFYGDSTQFINSVNQIVTNDSALVALDAYRICSLGMFVRRVVKGKLVCDIPIVEIVYDLLMSLCPSHPQISDIDFNHEHCFLCVNTLDANKSTGVKALLEKWGMPGSVIMIGDSMADYLALPQVHHFAVGNAHPDYKKLSDQVAQNKFAQGCVELLAKL